MLFTFSGYPKFSRHARPRAGHPRLPLRQGVDGRVKPGHDDKGRFIRLLVIPAKAGIQ
jgi:hypothetical protein